MTPRLKKPAEVGNLPDGHRFLFHMKREKNKKGWGKGGG